MQWTLVVNVFLVSLATTTAVLAIFGETRRRDGGGFLNSITGLGWGALFCALLTLAAGITKEILTENESTRQQNENEQLKGTITELRGTIGNLQTELKAANDAVVDTREKLVTEQLASQKTTDAIQGYVYDRLSLATSRYIGILAKMIAEASDDWLPSSKKEFFSKTSVALLRRWLNAEGKAPVYPDRPWHRYFYEQSKEYEDAIVNILNAYASRLPPTLINSLSAVASSSLLSLPRMSASAYAVVASKKGWKASPMICMNLSVFEDDFEKGFVQLFGLITQIASAEKSYQIKSRMNDKLLLSGLRSVTRGATRLSEREVKIFLDSQKR